MKYVLQLCKKSPLPTKDGESLAIHQITKAFVSHHVHVDVLCMLTPKHNEFNPSLKLENTHYTTVDVNTDTNIADLLINVFCKEPYIVERFYDNKFEEKLSHLLAKQTYDYIILEGVFLGLYISLIKKVSKAKLILRAHNVEHLIWQRIAKEEKNILSKAYLRLVMNPKFELFERKVAQEVDAVVPISPLDEQYFKKICNKPILTIPMTVEDIPYKPIPKEFAIGFIGGMDWGPNKNGILWFLEQVWVPFYKQNPDARLEIAGRNFPTDKDVFKMKGVHLLGEVENAGDFISKQRIIIVPLFSGSGMRVKIIEAMNHARCVVSTKIGAEGIQYKHSENIYIADTKQAWLDALMFLKLNPEKLEQIALGGKQLIRDNYEQNIYANRFIKFLENV